MLTPLGDVLGLNGSQGNYYKAGNLSNTGTNALNTMTAANSSPSLGQAGNALMNGAGLTSVLSGMSPTDSAALAASPIYGSKVAQDQVMSDPTLAGLYGAGGTMSNANNTWNQLNNQGFTLQPQDVEAYGQAAGNIARQFGQAGQSLSQSLADRGMAGGNTGGAQAQFSGLQGNKNEALGQMQMAIAQNRYNQNMQRMGQLQGFIGSLGSMGQNAENSAYNRNLGGYNAQLSTANDAANQNRDDYTAQQNANQASITSQNANKIRNLGDAMSNGMYQGTQAAFGGAASNGLTAAGKSLSGALVGNI